MSNENKVTKFPKLPQAFIAITEALNEKTDLSQYVISPSLGDAKEDAKTMVENDLKESTTGLVGAIIYKLVPVMEITGDMKTVFKEKKL